MDGKQLQGGHAVDYADSLQPGYRFCPTDSELIEYYLKPKIEKQIHPRCRFYDANIYDYHPKELAEKYTACEDKWYFLTPREPRYAKGKRPNRQTKDDGTWKASQRYTTVESSNGRVVGLKRSLAYFEEHVKKTEWLMHEYTTTENKMSDCVLCKIYKKETSETKNKRAIIQDKRNQQADKNQEEPSPIRRRISAGNHNNQPQQQAVQINHLGTNAQMMAASPTLGRSFMPNVNQHHNTTTDTTHHPFPAQALTGDQRGAITRRSPNPITVKPIAMSTLPESSCQGVVTTEEVFWSSTSQKQSVSASINSSIGTPNSYPVDPFSMTSKDECFQHQHSVKSSPIQSTEVPQVDNQDDGFDEILALLDEDNVVDEIDKDSNQSMEVPKDNDEDEIAKLMEMFGEDDAEDEIDKNSKQSMEVPQVDNEGDEFDEIMTLLDAEDEINDKESKQSMEVPKDNDEDEIAKLMAMFDEDDAEDEIHKNSKKSMEVAEHDVGNELDKVMARSEDKDVSRISFSRSDCVEVFSLDDLFSR